MRLTDPLPQGQAFLSPGEKRSSPGIVPVATDLLRGARGCLLALGDGRCNAGLLSTAATQTPPPHVVISRNTRQGLQCQGLSVQPETATHSVHQTCSLSQAVATAPATDPSAGPLWLATSCPVPGRCQPVPEAAQETSSRSLRLLCIITMFALTQGIAHCEKSKR